MGKLTADRNLIVDVFQIFKSTFLTGLSTCRQYVFSTSSFPHFKRNQQLCDIVIAVDAGGLAVMF